MVELVERFGEFNARGDRIILSRKMILNLFKEDARTKSA